MNANDWISVKDKLPEDDESCCKYDWVLVFGQTENGSINGSDLFGIANRAGNKWNINNDEGVHSDVGFFDLKPEDITHWMKFVYPDN